MELTIIIWLICAGLGYAIDNVRGLFLGLLLGVIGVIIAVIFSSMEKPKNEPTNKEKADTNS